MKQILIVEDDSFLNKMLAYNLTADGYGVTSALNARTAADAIRQREFNLVLVVYKRGFIIFGVVSLTMGNSGLPVGNGLARDVDLFCQFLL